MDAYEIKLIMIVCTEWCDLIIMLSRVAYSWWLFVIFKAIWSIFFVVKHYWVTALAIWFFICGSPYITQICFYSCKFIHNWDQNIPEHFVITVAVNHNTDVIMTTIASQITSLTIVYLIVYSDAYQRKHQSSTSLAFVWGIHRDRWIPRTKGQ